MDQYPTEEEEYELVYGDDLDAMNDMDSEPPPEPKGGPPAPRTPSNALRFARASSVSSNYRTPGQLGTIDESPLASPALSIITRGSSTTHKRLFDTPGPSSASSSKGVYGRAASTPFPGATNSQENALQALQQIDANPRKRRLEALFGDIQDIEEEPLELYEYSLQKKTKTEEEQDMELIERILEARQRFNTVANPSKPSMLSRAEALHRFKMDNISREPPKWPSMTVRRNDQTVYVRFHSEEFEKKQIDELNCAKDGYNGLLGADKERIWREANEIVAKRLTEPINAIETPSPGVEEIIIPSESGSVLWVEKYRPRRYIDLLSDETTNRSLLQWLKLWDKAVFNREPKKAKDANKPQHQQQQLNSFNKRTGRFESNGGWVKGGGRKPRSTLNTELDENGCPVQKVALLCGPPGLGKTTLAHTIARHAGYTVREVNASDDRSPDAFRLVLENGTQMKSVLNEEKRPNCIVLDEIDGAPVAAIEFLLRFIAGNGPAGQKGGGKKAGSGKATRDKFVLKRPIICICNDMYAPALRQLRLVAFVVNFPPTECSRLADRLLTIAKREDITTDLSSMMALADKTGNDVRACLSMLQFFACAKKPIRLTDVLKCNVGQKDRQKGLFSIWSSIFQIQRPKKTITADPDATVTDVVTLTDMSAATRMSNVLEVITMAGDYERLMQGVYENYLHQKMPDADMCGVAEATEWFCFNDRLQRTLHQLQNYAIYPYLSYAFVMWHYLFATMAWPKINFPSKGYEHTQKLASTKLVLTGLRKGISAYLKGIGEGSRVLVETIPLLKRVINPSLRSVSVQLLTQKEKSDLTHTVEVMADFGLNYIQLKTPEGTYQYQLNPDLDQLCHFNGMAPQSSTYFGKQIVAREVELEQMRRAQPKVVGDGGAGKVATKPGTNRSKENRMGTAGLFGKGKPAKDAQKTSPPELPNHLRTLKPKQIVQKTKQVTSKDFFGRICTKETALPVKEGGTDAIVKSPIWYRYKEGFNNAVRKDITLQDLM
ncbi:chromosome transmission fidelity protein 18 homolog [Anopheles ziemanni]|uniref:chromosome transmission fidelity protein 18 homolog n=1 Tax=Anopheles coustani TaxID=139045 RepID=UPI00265AE240|nr:chromosome transmission fidelity protein 18 homolog [Anopheles coustani]XP_058166758.1 chromosome transmission fidelity protein 18 homolog [Anopheles ziemanni]